MESFNDLRYKGKMPNEEIAKIAAESTMKTSICAHGKAIGPLYNQAMNYLKKKASNK